jgi:hypothetical protein
MKKICTQCQTEMIEDCKVESFGGISISKKDRGFFNTTYGTPKAAVCSTCGCVIFYIDNYKDFVK